MGQNLKQNDRGLLFHIFCFHFRFTTLTYRLLEPDLKGEASTDLQSIFVVLHAAT